MLLIDEKERNRFMKTEIVLHDICKNYGKKEVLKHVTLTIPRGMFGLLGRNGAGRTTWMKILVTLLPANSGSISMCSVDINKRKEIRDMAQGTSSGFFHVWGNDRL